MPARNYDHAWQQMRFAILERDRWQCQIHGPRCKTVATQADHIIPLSEGGRRLDPDNLRAACAPCNIGRQNTRNATITAALNASVETVPSRNW